MTTLVHTLAGLEESIIALERRGIGLRIHAERQDPATGKLPVYHVFVGGREEWFVTREALDAFVAKEEAAAGGKLNVDSGIGRPAPPRTAPSANGDTHDRSRPSSASSSCTKSARSTRCSPTSKKPASTSTR